MSTAPPRRRKTLSAGSPSLKRTCPSAKCVGVIVVLSIVADPMRTNQGQNGSDNTILSRFWKGCCSTSMSHLWAQTIRSSSSSLSATTGARPQSKRRIRRTALPLASPRRPLRRRSRPGGRRPASIPLRSPVSSGDTRQESDLQQTSPKRSIGRSGSADAAPACGDFRLPMWGGSIELLPCRFFASCQRKFTGWARMFLPYGPGDSPERLVPSVIEALLSGRPVDLSHGRQERDFVYAPDVADLLVRLLAGGEEGAFNVGTGYGTQICSSLSGLPIG